MAKIGYTRKPDGQYRVPPSMLVPGRHLIGQRPPRPDLAEYETGPPDSGYSSLHRLTDFNHTCPIKAGLFDQQPTCLTRHRVRLSLTRVTKSYLLALGNSQISSYFTKH